MGPRFDFPNYTHACKTLAVPSSAAVIKYLKEGKRGCTCFGAEDHVTVHCGREATAAKDVGNGSHCTHRQESESYKASSQLALSISYSLGCPAQGMVPPRVGKPSHLN